MEPITPEQLKREIDTLDTAYLGLAYRVLQQFPHTHTPQNLEDQTSANTEPRTFSQRWRGQLDARQFSPEALAVEPRLAYLVERYKLWEYSLTAMCC